MTRVRVATYNIHKGVQGVGPARRLEIHNLGHAVEQLDADIVCLQEVRKMVLSASGFPWVSLTLASSSMGGGVRGPTADSSPMETRSREDPATAVAAVFMHSYPNTARIAYREE